MDWLWWQELWIFSSLAKALQLSLRVSQTKFMTKLTKAQTRLEIGQWHWCNSECKSGGSSLVHCSGINTCSKDSPLILPARQTDREIDDCVGKWQPGEKLTCKWCRVRDGGEGQQFSVCASVDVSRGDVCGESSWQLSSYTTCLPGKERGKPLLLSKQPHPAAWCCCHGVGSVLVTAAHTRRQWEKTVRRCHLNWGRMQLFPISPFCPPLRLSSGLSCFLSDAKNSPPQTPWQPLILELGCR